MTYNIDNALTRPELNKSYHIVDSWDEFSCKGKLVAILDKDIAPSHTDVLKYYGEYAPFVAFRPCIVDRFIIEIQDKESTHYLIIPEHERWSYYLLEDK